MLGVLKISFVKGNLFDQITLQDKQENCFYFEEQNSILKGIQSMNNIVKRINTIWLQKKIECTNVGALLMCSVA